MKRRTEFLVEKRDGRREWLRLAKLARSVHLALSGAHATEPWLADQVAATVIAALRRKHARTNCLTTEAIAAAVQQVLFAIGYAPAAHAYARVGAERVRRKRLVCRHVAGVPGLGAPARASVSALSGTRFPPA